MDISTLKNCLVDACKDNIETVPANINLDNLAQEAASSVAAAMSSTVGAAIG